MSSGLLSRGVEKRERSTVEQTVNEAHIDTQKLDDRLGVEEFKRSDEGFRHDVFPALEA